MVYLQPVRRPHSLSTARQKAVQFILQTISRTYGQLRVPFRKQPRRYLKRDFLQISFIFFSFIKASYKGYIQAVLFLKYRQCIIIALVVQRNFLYFSFIFYSFISYIFPLCFTVLLKQFQRLYIGGFIFQVLLVSDYNTCYINCIYAFGTPTTYLRVWCTNYLLTRLVHS